MKGQSVSIDRFRSEEQRLIDRIDRKAKKEREEKQGYDGMCKYHIKTQVQ